MKPPRPLFESVIADLPLLGRGKVRDIYAIDADYLLIVTTDRLSAYDVVMPDPVPGKGEILTRISNFWFAMMADIVPNHLTGRGLDGIISNADLRKALEPRSIVCRRLRPLPIEAVVRGYLIGSGWRDYLASGKVCGIALPPGLQQAERLPEVLGGECSPGDMHGRSSASIAALEALALPVDVVPAMPAVEGTRQHEHQVAQTVEVLPG